jgi:hypothetical protein
MIQECFRTSTRGRCSFCFRLAHSASFLFCIFPLLAAFFARRPSAQPGPSRASARPSAHTWLPHLMRPLEHLCS